jgi:hypothetical protein
MAGNELICGILVTKLTPSFAQQVLLLWRQHGKFVDLFKITRLLCGPDACMKASNLQRHGNDLLACLIVSESVSANGIWNIHRWIIFLKPLDGPSFARSFSAREERSQMFQKSPQFALTKAITSRQCMGANKQALNGETSLLSQDIATVRHRNAETVSTLSCHAMLNIASDDHSPATR